jgi:DNA (cytosine-5)-methyltransferase 1
MGYHQAGFDVVGVDNTPQPRYPFEFHQADALTFPLEGYDVIHASPPCQAFSVANHIHGRSDHPDLIGVTRQRLQQVQMPYIIENVPGAPLRAPAVLCGLAFGLNVKRHRWFETSFPLLVPPCGDHTTEYLVIFGGSPRTRAKQLGRTEKDGPILRRGRAPIQDGRAAMGIDWMNGNELSQAIPPAYTCFIGEVLRVHLEAAA